MSTERIILIVEDDKITAQMLKAVLEEEGYTPVCVGTVKEAIDFLTRTSPSLMVLDICLPDGHGLEVCKWARKNPNLAKLPIIVLSGQGELDKKKAGFQSGVDQYLTKPVVSEEFVMWTNALLRRIEMDRSSEDMITLGPIQIDSAARTIKYRGNLVNTVTCREFDLLYALIKASPKTISRTEILCKIWKTVAVQNLVDTHIFNLRNKLPEEIAKNIQSVPGKGFRYLG